MLESQELIKNLINYGNFQIYFERNIELFDVLEVVVEEAQISIDYKRSYYNFKTGEYSDEKTIKQYDESILPYYLALVLISSCNCAGYAKVRVGYKETEKNGASEDAILKICSTLDQILSHWQVKDMITFVKSSELEKVNLLTSKTSLPYNGHSSLNDLVEVLNKKISIFCHTAEEVSLIKRNLEFNVINMDSYRKWQAYKNDESDLLQLKK